MRFQTAWWALLLTVASLAGCVGNEVAGPDGDALGTGAPPEGQGPRTLDTVPQLRLGEWWNVTLHSRLDGSTHEARLVVAGQANGSYLVGMPAEAFVHEVLILHLPGVGLVDRASFGYEAHDAVFDPVRFPLEPGRSWSTAWYTGPVDAEVTEVGQGRARVEHVGNNTRINVTYAPGLGLPSAVEVAGYGSYEVTDHGYGYEGEVTVPVGRDLVILNGRIGPALDTTLSPGPPVETVDVGERYDRLTGALVLGNLLVDGPPGVYRAQATASDGTSHEATHAVTPDGPGVSINVFVQDDPGGTWQLEYEAGGPGVAAVEAVAYDVERVNLGAAPG